MNELVYLKNDEAVCDSLQVAEKFGKRHDKLIAEIRRMYGELIGKRELLMIYWKRCSKLSSPQSCLLPAKERLMMDSTTECI